MKKKVEKENANYKNAQLGVDYTFAFLEKFEHHELRNRYMHLEYKETEQAPNKLVTCSVRAILT